MKDNNGSRKKGPTVYVMSDAHKNLINFKDVLNN